MLKVAFIFPGQGAQYVGMGQDFYHECVEAKAVFDEAESLIPGLLDVMFNGPEEALTTKYCQPAIFTHSAAALVFFQNQSAYKKYEASFACGLSLGEYSALYSAGCLTFEDTLRLVQKRSMFMEEATQAKKGAMAAIIGLEEDVINEVCQSVGAQVANYNAPDQIVITGEEERVKKASDMLNEKGAKRVIALQVSGAFHSELMKPAAEKFDNVLHDFNFSNAKFPVLSNVDAFPTCSADTIKSNLTDQITSSVQWVKSVNEIAANGVTHFVEIGPGSVLKGLLRKINRELTVFNLRNVDDFAKLAA